MLMLRRGPGMGVTGEPPISTSPSVGSTRPAIMRNVVVLPQPLGPSSATSSPAAMRSVTLSTAVLVANTFVKPEMARSVALSVTASAPEDLVELIQDGAALRIDLLPVEHVELHLAHARLGIGNDRGGLGIELDAGHRRRGSGIFRHTLLHGRREGTVDEGRPAIGFG